MAPKNTRCKKCRKIVTSDSVECWASHLRSCANVCSETKSLLPTAKDSCRASVIVIDGSTQSNGCLPGPSSSWKNQPSCSYIGTPEVLELEREPKRRARARSELSRTQTQMYVTMIIAYSITSRTEGLANKLVRRNVSAPIRIESSRDVTVIRFQ